LEKDNNRIFISYAPQDLHHARKIRDGLKAAGYCTWLENDHLLPGQERKAMIRKAIRESRFFLLLISRHSVSRGPANRQTVQALDILNEFPQDDIFVIPARLEPCEPSHEKLGELEYADLFPDWDLGFQKILSAVQTVITLPGTEKMNFGNLVHRTCNRDKEKKAYECLLSEKSKESCIAANVQLIVMEGEAHDCHFSLVDRLYQECLADFCQYASVLPPKEVLWPEPGEDDPEICCEILLQELFCSLFDKNAGKESCSPENFIRICRELNLKEYRAVVISHEIETDAWNRSSAEMLHRYVRHFWAEVAKAPDLPLFQIFLCFVYPETGRIGTLARWGWNCFTRYRMCRDIQRFSVSAEQFCSCRYLGKMKPVSYKEVKNWFIRNKIPMKQEERRTRLNKFFNKRKQVPMSEVEKWLKELVNEFSGLQHTIGELT